MLNSGGETDDARAIFDRYADFDIGIMRQAWGVKLELHNAPASAFVDGRMIRGIQEHLFAVLRDILYIHGEVYEHGSVELREPQGITNAVYRILRNAGLLLPRVRPDIVVCWGGHSINREEYEYTKKVGYELGLRGLNVCTGCGPGAMKGPMKGAAIGHAKQRIHAGPVHRPHRARHRRGRAAERDREPARDPAGHRKAPRGVRAPRPRHRRVPGRRGHGRGNPLPDRHPARPAERAAAVSRSCSAARAAARTTSGRSTRSWSARSANACASATGSSSTTRPRSRARCCAAWRAVREYRRRESDAYNYNWLLRIPHELQKPFEPTHAAMASLNLRRDAPAHELAAELRRAFSGIVAGNVKESGLKLIDQYGPFELHGDPELLKPLDAVARVVRAPAAHEAVGRIQALLSDRCLSSFHLSHDVGEVAQKRGSRALPPGRLLTR